MRVKFNSLFENILLKEGTKYDKKASKLLVDADLFDQEDSDSIINDLFRNKIHAFVHSPSWLEKYLVGIARMIVEESDGDSNQADMFLDECSEVFDKYLTYVKEIRDKQADPVKFDREFMDKMSYQEVKDFNEKYQKELDQKSKDELSKMNFASSNYELVPINSYEEMYDKFGGRLTGDGSSEGYAGDGFGGTAWCHTNNKSTYKYWIDRGDGDNRFFVLMNKNFKDIPFNSKTNSEKSGKDDYGNSLIAILVDKYGNLKNATLRCNHVGVGSNADNQYKTYAELSKIAGFNVEEKVKELAKESGGFSKNLPKFDLASGTYHYEGGELPHEMLIHLQDIREVFIGDNVTKIEKATFLNCQNLTTVYMSNRGSLEVIEEAAFESCTSLWRVYLPDSVKRIEDSAFRECSSMRSIRMSENIEEIGDYAFFQCHSLREIILPVSTAVIGEQAFAHCESLEMVTVKATSFNRLGKDIFDYCPYSLEVVCDGFASTMAKYCEMYGYNYTIPDEYLYPDSPNAELPEDS